MNVIFHNIDLVSFRRIFLEEKTYFLIVVCLNSDNTTINAVNITQLLLQQTNQPVSFSDRPANQNSEPSQPANQEPEQEQPANQELEPGAVVIIEPKNKVQAQLVSCLTAIQCVEPLSCMFAQVIKVIFIMLQH